MSTHTHFLHGGHVGSLWKQTIAGVGVAALTVLAIYEAVLRWHNGGVSEGLMMLALFAGPAVTYALAYFWCVPEALGGSSSDSQRTLHQCWVDFGLLGSFFASVVILLSYARTIYMNWSYVSLPRAVCLVFVAAWIIPSCVMASEHYLSQAIPVRVTGVSSGWRALVRRMMRCLGAWPVKALGPSSATLFGGVLILMSLALLVDGSIFGSEHTGYQILTDTDSTSWGAYSSPIWPMAQEVILPGLAVADRVWYGLSLLVALFALAGVATRRFEKVLPGTRILTAFAGIVALLELTGMATSLVADLIGKWVVVPWLACWAIPIAVWTAKAKAGTDGDPVRIAILVFYLPVFMIAIAFMVFFSYFAIGYGAFLLGMLMLWWGLLQTSDDLMHRKGTASAV
jgi:hypothetical protein